MPFNTTKCIFFETRVLYMAFSSRVSMLARGFPKGPEAFGAFFLQKLARQVAPDESFEVVTNHWAPSGHSLAPQCLLIWNTGFSEDRVRCPIMSHMFFILSIHRILFHVWNWPWWVSGISNCLDKPRVCCMVLLWLSKSERTFTEFHSATRFVVGRRKWERFFVCGASCRPCQRKCYSAALRKYLKK